MNRHLPNRTLMSRLTLALMMLPLTACASISAEEHAGPGDRDASLGNDHLIAADGYELPLHRWLPESEPEGVVLALHGFNDYGGAFSVLSGRINGLGMALYSYDQRGFGATEPRGIWPGQERLVNDARTAAKLLRDRYPDVPLYMMGKSMGGGITILALTSDDPPPVDGSILIAPGVWGRDIMPWYQQFGLWAGETMLPGLELSVELAHMLGHDQTDDLEVREAMNANPYVERSPRMDTISGVGELMSNALKASDQLTGPTLILYGDNDEVIPAEPFCQFLDRLPDADSAGWRLALYPGGYHMLTRYTGSEQVHDDIEAWLKKPSAPLPSGHEAWRTKAKDHLCD